jgi:hypothetical protein
MDTNWYRMMDTNWYRWLRGILLAIFVAVVLTQWSLGVYFAARAPTSPDRTRAAIYPVRIHQSTVYITKVQSYWYNDWVFDLGFYSGAPVMLTELLAQRRRRKQTIEADV